MDLALLTDPTRCPDCAGILPTQPVSCPTCSLPLQGPLVERLWRLSLQAAETLDQRQRVLVALRDRNPIPVGAGNSGWGRLRTDVRTRPVGPGLAAPADAWVPGPRRPERDRVTPRQIQHLLLGLGVLLLAVAALIFTVVAWGRIGIGGRTAILGALTVGAGFGARLAHRRELPGTAEALASLTLALLLLDSFGARENDLAGLGGTATDAYWAGVIGVLAALAAAAHRALPLRTLGATAAIGIQLPLAILGDRLGERTLTLAMLAQGTVLLLVVRRTSTVAVLLAVGGATAYFGATGNAAVLAYDADPSGPAFGSAAGSAVLVAVAATAALIAFRHRALESVPQIGAAAATAALLGAAHAPMFRAFTPESATAGAAGLLLAAALLLCAAPRRYVDAPLAVLASGGLLTLLGVAKPVARAIDSPLQWIGTPWTQSVHGDARSLLGDVWPYDARVVLTLALLTTAAGVLAWRLRTTPVGMGAGAAAATLATATALVLPVAANVPYLVAVLGLVGVGCVLFVLAARLAPRSSAVALAGAGAVPVGFGLAWSFAARPATPLALALVVAAAAVARLVAGRDLHPASTCVAALAVIAEAGTLTLLAGQSPAVAGTAALVVAGVFAAGARFLADPERDALELAAMAAATLAFLPVSEDARWASIALLAAGTATAVVALRPQRRLLGWVAGVLLSVSGWIRLALADVETPEAYSTGPALALLVVGVLARRGDRELSSWRAYGPALTTGLLPSLALSLDGDGLTRPLLLGLPALVVLLAGVRSRLQAPLVLGAAVLALDALIQIAPYADAVPRWVSIGGAGLLLLVLGVTFERRLRNVRRLGAKLAELG